MNNQTIKGMLIGLIAIVAFSLTVPVTKIALQSFSPYFAAVERVFFAGVLSAIILFFKRTKFPDSSTLKLLVITALGSSFGFPLFTSIALSQTDSAHAGVVFTIIPLFTAILGALFNRQKHTYKFWILAISGCLTVLSYMTWKSNISFVSADFWLIAASVSAAISYTFGTEVSKRIGGLNTICWSLVIALPLTLPSGLILLNGSDYSEVSRSSIYAMIYVSTISQLLGFVPWYAGLRIGGIAKVSQVQLLQVFLTLVASYFLLNETIDLFAWIVAILVVVQIYFVKSLR
jgi:drug/metabolite transporter (DMT)-like permease